MFNFGFPDSDERNSADSKPDKETGSLKEFEKVVPEVKNDELFLDSLKTDINSDSAIDASQNPGADFSQAIGGVNEDSVNENNVDETDANETDPLSDLFTGKQAQKESPDNSPAIQAVQTVLFVTPDANLSPHLLFALRVEHIEALVSNNCDDALIRFGRKSIGRALIHSSFKNCCQGLVTALRNQNAQIAISFYSSEAGLLTGDVSGLQATELLETNLRLAAYLTESPENTLVTHNMEVADLCSRLADKFNFSDNLRLALLSAAQWHDIAARDLKTSTEYNESDIITLSASRMKALHTPSVVIHLLQIMAHPNQDVEGVDAEITLAGCVLALANHYCHYWPSPASVKSEQHYEIRNDIQQFARSLIRSDVAEALLEIIDTELVSEQPDNDSFSVHILDMADTRSSDIEHALQSAGFCCTVSHSVSDCARRWTKDTPQALIALHAGDVQDITDMLFALALNGITIATTPTMLLIPEERLDKVIWSIKHGIEDVFPLTLNPAVLVAKITRSQKRLEDLSRVRISALQDLGTHGSLEDMNLIKLLEALRDSSRPLRLNVTAEGWQLTIFVKDNCVLTATCNELTGIDAISQSLGWTRGVWSIDPIDEQYLPNLNLGMSIDSVMLEACVKCDITTHVSAKS